MENCIECGKRLGFGEKGLLGLGLRCSQCETNQVLRENAQNKSTVPKERRTEEEIHEAYIKFHEKLAEQSVWFWAINILILISFSIPGFKQKYLYNWDDYEWWLISLVILISLGICFVIAQKFRQFVIKIFPQNEKYAGTGSPLLNWGSLAIVILNIYVVFNFNIISWSFKLIKNLWEYFMG